MATLETIKQTHNLNKILHLNAKEYQHTTPLAISKSGLILPDKKLYDFNIIYDIKDILYVGAITENPVLLTGGTDAGKTTLAMQVMNGLFGQPEKGWHRLDVDNDFGKDTYTDVSSDFFHESGKTLEDLYSLHNWLQLPGFIADELNRAHAKVVTKAMHIIKEKEVTLPDGRRAKVGYPIDDSKNSKTYQFQVATINEGADYSGTFDIDKALRRRTTIEIPIDVFSLNSYDKKEITQKDNEINLQFDNYTNYLSTVLNIKKELNNMPLHINAELFINYLGAFDFCDHSLTKEKGSVPSRNGSISHICSQNITLGRTEIEGSNVGCQFLKTFDNNLCPYVRGLSGGLIKNLKSVSRGFAALRATKFVEMLHGVTIGETSADLSYSFNNVDKFKEALELYTGKSGNLTDITKFAAEKYVSNLDVRLEDVQSALGFVGYSKIGISNEWVAKYCQGNRYAAISSFSNQARTLLESSLARDEFTHIDKIMNGGDASGDFKKILSHCSRDNPWLGNVMSAYRFEAKDAPSMNDMERFYQ